MDSREQKEERMGEWGQIYTNTINIMHKSELQTKLASKFETLQLRPDY